MGSEYYDIDVLFVEKRKLCILPLFYSLCYVNRFNMVTRDLFRFFFSPVDIYNKVDLSHKFVFGVFRNMSYIILTNKIDV